MIMHVVGNRPQFIKLAPVMRELKSRGIPNVIVHTGQHYDENMSDIFFQELGIDTPYKNLHIGSGTHAEITGTAMIKLEEVFLKDKPEIVIVYGDTNTTLAAALAAVKIGVPIVHVEAGPRTYEKNNPEEINRKIVDHVSDLLCCPDEQSIRNLKQEGIINNIFFTGDVMYDTFLYSKKNCNQELCKEYGLEYKNYIFMTWHRQENTENKERMEKILNFISKMKYKVLCPLHPRTKNALKNADLLETAENEPNLIMVDPLGYMDVVSLMSHCRFILCDSGGVSKESCYAGVKCYFMLDFNPWTDLVNDGHIVTINFEDYDDVEQKIKEANEVTSGKLICQKAYYGDGYAAKKIVDLILGTGLIKEESI